jgi:uncharacterized protein (DUF1499 family)
MRLAANGKESTASRWTSRVALFSLGLLVAAAFLHRLFGLPTAVAFNLFLLAMALCVLSILLGLVGTLGIWRTGAEGSARIVLGIFLSTAMLLAPVLALLFAHQYPLINDLTTDPQAPPAFVSLAKARGPGDNPPDYPGPSFASQQAAAYPDLKPMVIDRSSEETFELVTDALRKLKIHVVHDEAPGAAGAPGVIEAVDRTLIAGFYDDVAIRVSGDEAVSRVDIRSASRFGSADLGRNAERIRLIMHEITMRVQATVPTADDEKAQRSKREAQQRVKRGKDADPRTEGRRRSQDRAE